MMLHAQELNQRSENIQLLSPSQQTRIGVVQGSAPTTEAYWPDWPVVDPGTVDWSLATEVTGKFRFWSSPYDQSSPFAQFTRTPLPFDRTTYHVIDDTMARLEIAASQGDERAFVAALAEIDWTTKRPEDFVKAIALALAVGAYLAARNLSQQGADMFSEHLKIQNYARVLASPKTTRMSTSSHASLNKNRDWLMKHGDKYRGQWVALQDGQLLGSAASLHDLKRRIDDTAGVLFTKVF